MASEVQIANRALQRLGAGRIVALDGASKESRECNVAYEPCRDYMLRSHPWGFAIKRAALAADSSTAASSWSTNLGRAFAYTWPSDAVRILLPSEEEIDWLLEGRKILTDWDAPLEVRYVARITDPNLMDPLFREAVSCWMAHEMCEALTQSNTKKAGLREDLKDVIAEARRINAIERPPVQTPDHSWDTERR